MTCKYSEFVRFDAFFKVVRIKCEKRKIEMNDAYCNKCLDNTDRTIQTSLEAFRDNPEGHA